jgi:hypothetical protein
MQPTAVASKSKGIIVLISFFVFVFSCKKNNDAPVKNITGIADVSTSGTTKVINLQLTPANQNVTALTLKNTGSSGAVHVKLKLDSSAITATGIVKFLPTANYTLSTLEYDVPANGTVNVPLTINTTNLTGEFVYAIGLKISEVNNGEIDTAAKNIAIRIDFRNRYDGRYRVTGTFTDYAAPTLTFTEFDTDLITTNSNSVVMIPTQLGIPGYLILSGTSLSYYGSFGPVFQFNTTTNAMTGVVNSYGQPAGNTRSAEMDPAANNRWEATSKSIVVRFWQNQPSVVTTPPHHRVYFINTLIYLGPRN